MDDPLTPEENQKYWACVADRDRVRIETIEALKSHLMATLERRELVATYELPVLTWLSVIDEIENRHETGFAALLRDNMMSRLGSAIERLHDEVNYLVAAGPATVAERMAEDRARPARQVASRELQKMTRGPRG